MKKIPAVLSLLVMLSCGRTPSATDPASVVSRDTAFEKMCGNFVEDLWRHSPEWASSLGRHEYDDILEVSYPEARTKKVNFCKAWMDSLYTFDPKKLSPKNCTDYYLIENHLAATLWGIIELKAYEWNPASYNVGEGFALILGGTHDSLSGRLRALYGRMEKVPQYYDAAVHNIKNPSLEHTALAIEQNEGNISMFEKDMLDSLRSSSLTPVEKKDFSERAVQCAKAVRSYIAWLKKTDNSHPRDFRLGKKLYLKKFEYEMVSSFTAEEIYQRALKRKEELHAEMAKLAKQLWPKYSRGDKKAPVDELELIRTVIDRISLDHVSRDSFQLAIEAQIPLLEKFIRENDLLAIDPSKPLVVRKEPAYMQGVAGASVSSPGPYEKNGKTYYNVGSMAAWDKERAESYLREYNRYILRILNTHEAVPGHYTQLVYANQSPDIIKAILGNSAMIEGWAVYGERMMLENGFGDNSPEMWLMYYKWHLRSVCNTILDYSVHVLGMSREDAIELLTREAFQQRAEAAGKWKRVTLTQVQLCCYFTGFTEIYELRNELKRREGNNFSLKKFHEQFLSYGSAPVKYIREMMLNP